jgi:hypothetical protein
MSWIVLSYSLPTNSRSSPRVALWRRLQRLGAVSPTGSIYVLPTQAECIEAFQWLAQEVRQAQGEALVMQVEQFEGLSNTQLIQLFQNARRDEYGEVEAQLAGLEQSLAQGLELNQAQSLFDKLQRQYSDISRIDYFQCPEAAQVAGRLAHLVQLLRGPASVSTTRIAAAAVETYQDKCWVTRPRPHVDRLACIWLIRRFINPAAVIRYALQAEPDEIPFDMPEAQFGHQGNFCTFETMIQAFGLVDPALQRLAEIIHAIDVRDGQYNHPEIAGVEAILKGWLLANLSDAELETHGVRLFEGLYNACLPLKGTAE